MNVGCVESSFGASSWRFLRLTDNFIVLIGTKNVMLYLNSAQFRLRRTSFEFAGNVIENVFLLLHVRRTCIGLSKLF